MIGIDTVPDDDVQPLVVEQVEEAVILEPELDETVEVIADSDLPVLPVVNEEEGERPAPSSSAEDENADDLLRRLEEEKQEWQRQLAAMKETLDAQDRKIEEDRQKRRDALESVAEANKTALVSKKKAPTRTVARGAQQVAGMIPVVSERTRTMWPGMADFHQRRARVVGKAMPGLAAAFANGTLGFGPARYANSMNAGTLSKYHAFPQTVSSGGWQLDSTGRLMRPAQVVGGAQQAVVRRQMGINGSVVVTQGGAVTPSVPLVGTVSGVPLVGSQQHMPVVSTSSARPAVASYDSSSSWLGGTCSYVMEGATTYLNPGSWMPGYPSDMPQPTLGYPAPAAAPMNVSRVASTPVAVYRT